MKQISLLLFSSKLKDDRLSRMQIILSYLAFGSTAIAFVAFLISLARYLAGTLTNDQASPLVMFTIFTFNLSFNVLVRLRFSAWQMYVYLVLNYLLATYALLEYGSLLLPAILMYLVVIVTSGLLFRARIFLFALIVVFVSLISINLLDYLSGDYGNVEYYRESNNPGDIFISITFAIQIAMITWLYSREVASTLNQLEYTQSLLLEEKQLLEKRVNERTMDLENSYAQQEVELHRFAEFGRLNSSLLHDLASPLMAVSMNLYELEGSSSRDKLIKQIRSGIEAMEAYVNTAREDLTQDKRKIEQVNVKQLVMETIELYGAKIEINSCKVIVEIEHSMTFVCDKVRMEQLLGNIISNALDAMITCDTKVLTVFSSLRKGALEVRISDTGKGIKQSELKNIFKPFVTSKEESKGVGLGLYIVSKIANELSAKISIDTSPAGTKFIIVFPKPEVNK
jgi:signal transduction histidine kinase